MFKFNLSEQNFLRRPYLKLSTSGAALVVWKLIERSSPVTVFVLVICGQVSLDQMTANRHSAEIPSYRLKDQLLLLFKN